MDYAAFTHERRSTQHILMRDGVHSIYSLEMESTVTDNIWSPKQIFVERWTPQNILMRDRVHIIYVREVASTAFTEKGETHSIYS